MANEIQELHPNGASFGGFTLTYPGTGMSGVVDPSMLNGDAVKALVDYLLAASGVVSVVDTAGTYQIEFMGGLADTDVPLLVVSDDTTTAGVYMSVVQEGGPSAGESNCVGEVATKKLIIEGTATFEAPPPEEYSASGTVTTKKVSIVGLATVENPILPIDAVGMVRTKKVSITGTATYDPPYFEADGSIQTKKVSVAGSAQFAVSIGNASGEVSTGKVAIAGAATFTENNIQVSILPLQGAEALAPVELSFSVEALAPVELSILSPYIDPPYDVFAAHMGLGVVMFTWKHDDHELVEHYELLAAESLNGTYIPYHRGQFVDRHGIVNNIPTGGEAWFRMKAYGKNGAVSDYVQVKQGKLRSIDINMLVRGIAGSTIQAGARFNSTDAQTGLPIVIQNTDLLTLS